MPKASVIMTTFNTKEEFFCEAVNSIINQTFKDFEFIIVDDGSKIPVGEQLSFKNIKDDRIKILTNRENKGLIYSLNRAIDESRGEYIIRMDSDDIALPNRLEKQIDFLENNKDIDVLGTAFEKFPKTKVVIPPLNDEQIKYTLRFLYNPLAHPSIAMRKSTIDRLNIKYNPKHRICEDYGIWLHYVNELKFANLEEVLLKYRWHGNNVSKKKTDIQSAGAQKMMFEAQGKYFNLDYTRAIETINKYLDKKPINATNLKNVNNFILEVKSELKGQEYEVNRHFYKSLLQTCIRDVEFVKILFSKEVNSIIKLDIFFKIATLFGL